MKQGLVAAFVAALACAHTAPHLAIAESVPLPHAGQGGGPKVPVIQAGKPAASLTDKDTDAREKLLATRPGHAPISGAAQTAGSSDITGTGAGPKVRGIPPRPIADLSPKELGAEVRAMVAQPEFVAGVGVRTLDGSSQHTGYGGGPQIPGMPPRGNPLALLPVEQLRADRNAMALAVKSLDEKLQHTGNGQGGPTVSPMPKVGGPSVPSRPGISP
ncbi:hypothetical protein J2Y55_003710 [Bosea sp. BE125]|nr:hypothetical protein [Bosea sp. BE125]